MANFEIPNNPTFNQDMRRLETSDPAHASIFNALFQQLLYNCLYLNKQLGITKEAALTEAYQQSTGYTDKQIADLINGAPTTLDTLGEIADAMQSNADIVAALDKAIGAKANQAALDGHTGNNTVHITATERAKWDGITALTQNIKSIQVVGSLPSDAGKHTDTLYLTLD